ncbi:MAG: D-alanyl-D-alanine carboxypeptidase/D-alanyl-D-alanine-endopeptidase [Acidimicrobiales bacterium]
MTRFLVPVLFAGLAIGSFVVADRSSPELPEPVVESIDVTVTPILSARRVPDLLVEPLSRDALAEDLSELVTRAPASSCLVASAGGEDLFVHNGELNLVPASVQKLVTAAAALTELGPDYTFSTRILATAAPVDGVVSGDLFLVGGGDPLLATPGYIATFREQPQIHSPIEALADELVAGGLTRMTGSVVAVERRYDEVRYVETWPERFVTQGQSGPLSALTINDNFEEFPAERGTAVPVPPSDPALFNAGLFDDLLEERGVIVSASPREAGPDEDLTSLVEVAVLESPPLSQIVVQMLSTSDNVTAELLLKEIGLVRNGVGTTSEGAAAAVEILAEAGFPTPDLPPRDGSGLDEGNSVTCDFIVDLLESFGADSDLASGLAIAGETGTLRDRFTGTGLEGRLIAKTGSLNGVGTLAGFVETDAGRSVTFAFLVNGTIPPDLFDLQAEVGLEIAQYPEGPSPEAVAPVTFAS